MFLAITCLFRPCFFKQRPERSVHSPAAARLTLHSRLPAGFGSPAAAHAGWKRPQRSALPDGALSFWETHRAAAPNRPSEGSTAPRRDTDIATPTPRYQDAPVAPLRTPQPRAVTAPIGSRPGAVAAATVTAKGGRFPGPGSACPRPGWVRAAGRRDGGVPGARSGR